MCMCNQNKTFKKQITMFNFIYMPKGLYITVRPKKRHLGKHFIEKMENYIFGLTLYSSISGSC